MDNLTQEQRHKSMSSIRSKDTAIEVVLRKALWHRGNVIKLSLSCHCEERSDVAIRFLFAVKRGLPHQCAHWFAMTKSLTE